MGFEGLHILAPLAHDLDIQRLGIQRTEPMTIWDGVLFFADGVLLFVIGGAAVFTFARLMIARRNVMLTRFRHEKMAEYRRQREQRRQEKARESESAA